MAEKTDNDWETVSEGARINVQLNVIGDVLDGDFMGFQTITDPEDPEDTWEQALFDNVVVPVDIKGEPVAINPGYDLLRALKQIEPGKFRVRVTYARNIPIAGQPSPMKGYQVQKRPRAL